MKFHQRVGLPSQFRHTISIPQMRRDTAAEKTAEKFKAFKEHQGAVQDLRKPMRPQTPVPSVRGPDKFTSLLIDKIRAPQTDSWPGQHISTVTVIQLSGNVP